MAKTSTTKTSTTSTSRKTTTSSSRITSASSTTSRATTSSSRATTSSQRASSSTSLSAILSSSVALSSFFFSTASLSSGTIEPVVTASIPSLSLQGPSSASVASAVSISVPSSATDDTTLPQASNSYDLISRVLIISPIPNENGPLWPVTTNPLDGYGIPYDVLKVPPEGTNLPTLNTTTSDGKVICNYGSIAIHSQVAYYYPTTGAWRSALTDSQMDDIHAFQTLCGARLIHFNVWPGPAFGATPLGSCCDDNDPQDVSILADVAAQRFPTAGLRAVPLSLKGIYHVPAVVTDTNLTQTTPFLQFGPNSVFPDPSVGGVIRTYPDGRSEMIFFTGFALWSGTSAYLNHVWIHWATHGVYGGYRRVYLSTQIDDVMLGTEAFDTGISYRTSVKDMVIHANWVADINARLAKTNPGSKYQIELGINGNGNVLAANDINPKKELSVCQGPPVWYGKDADTTPLEFQKVLGTGTDSWPTEPANFSLYSLDCLKLDPLANWLLSILPVKSAFSFVSHTYTHLSLNNATYADTYKEINWNLQYFNLTGLSQSTDVSLGGLIPPAITGMHNGDALRAFMDNGVWNAVGDNTRPPLRADNPYHPYITTVANNGFDGFQITPRWATRIYFNCDTVACDLKEWIQTSAGSGDIYNLLSIEKTSVSNYLLSLHHDPYMFHQANMRTEGISDTYTITGTSISGKFSLLQLWTETIINEFQRLVNWPIITAKHDNVALDFKNRAVRDACNAQVTERIEDGKIVSVVVQTGTNSCDAEIPVTVPGGVKESDTNIRVEQIGNDSPTVWVKLNGRAITLTLRTPQSLTGL